MKSFKKSRALPILIPLASLAFFGWGTKTLMNHTAPTNTATMNAGEAGPASARTTDSQTGNRMADSQTSNRMADSKVSVTIRPIDTKTPTGSLKTALAPMKVSKTHGDMDVPILELHNSAYVPNYPYAAAPGQFAAEMKWLHNHDFHSITLDQLWNAIEYGDKLPSRPIVISFDDGHVSNYTMATPILKKYGYVATEFMPTGAIGKSGELTKQDLIDMENSGIWEIESHTVNHPHLTQLSSAQIAYQLTQSKQTLESILGRPVDYFCYPYGDYNNAVIEAVHKAGYRLATTVHQGYANPYQQGTLTLSRIACHEDLTLSQFAQKLSPSLQQPTVSVGIYGFSDYSQASSQSLAVRIPVKQPGEFSHLWLNGKYLHGTYANGWEKYSLNLAKGQNVISAQVLDANAQSSIEHKYVIYGSIPDATVDITGLEASVSEATQSVTVKSTYAKVVHFWVNGKYQSGNGGTYSITLTPGKNVLTTIATNAVGRKTVEHMDVILTTTTTANSTGSTNL